LLAIVDLPREGMQLLPFEEPTPHPPPECGVGQIFENEEGFIGPPELTDSPVKVIAGPTSEQALEAD
jgi:hypothetical protein